MQTARIIPHPKPKPKPRTFTSREDLIEQVRLEIFHSKRKYGDIAKACGVSNSTVANLASGKTKWPKATTLFPIVNYLGFDITLTRR